MLSEDDRLIVEAAPLDPSASMAFEALRACLVWSDEVPAGISADGREFVGDLLGARGYIHRHVPPELWDSPARLRLWNEALAAGLRWNGFRRIVLSEEQQRYLDASLADDSPL